MPQITARGPSGPPVVYRFDQDSITIGRTEGNDLVVRDPSISRLHAELRREKQGWVVLDHGSTNGTLLNGRPVAGPTTLVPGDEIQIAQTRLVFAAALAGAIPEGSTPHTIRLPWTSRGAGGDEATALIGRSPAMARVRALIEKVAASAASVLITGESGTGKEVVAKLIHLSSPRAARPYVVVNCPALPGTLLEAELFGVEKGVATGVEARPGRFEQAQGGTLLLDEVGDMEPAAQAKILRVLQERVVERLGGRERIHLDVRVLAATNQDLAQAMARGAFRRDLYHRLNVLAIELPALRERREDVRQLAEHFLSRPRGLEGTIEPEAMARLERYDFPGNVRELEHLIERARLLAETRVIRLADLPPEVRGEGPMASPPAAAARAGAVLPPPPGPAAPAPGAPADEGAAAELWDRVVEKGEPFWETVREPYLRREIPAEDVRRFIARAHREAGGSYRDMARRLGIEADYKKLLNFLNFHKLGVKR